MFTIIHQNIEDLITPLTFSNKVNKLKDNSDIHLWLLNRSFYDPKKSYSDYFLSDAEQYRAQKFRFRRDHDLFVTGRYFIRILLAYYTDNSPQNIKVILDTFGKPTSDLNLFFNISHSKDQLMLGFSNSSIGVDIEKKFPLADMQRIAKSSFSEKEYQTMMDFSMEKRMDRFFEIWTQKESLIKGVGKGLSMPLQDFNVTGQNGKISWRLPTEQENGNWFVQKIDMKVGYKSAFATQISTVNLSYLCLEN